MKCKFDIITTHFYIKYLAHFYNLIIVSETKEKDFSSFSFTLYHLGMLHLDLLSQMFIDKLPYW